MVEAKSVFTALRENDWKSGGALIVSGAVDLRKRGLSRMNVLEQIVHWKQVPDNEEKWIAAVLTQYRLKGHLYDQHQWWVRDLTTQRFYGGKLPGNVLDFAMFQNRYDMMQTLLTPPYSMSLARRGKTNESSFSMAVRYSRDRVLYEVVLGYAMLSTDEKEYAHIRERILETDNDVALEALLFNRKHGLAYYKWLLGGRTALEDAQIKRAPRCMAVIADVMQQRGDRKSDEALPAFALAAQEEYAGRKAASAPDEEQFNQSMSAMEADTEKAMRYVVNDTDTDAA